MNTFEFIQQDLEKRLAFWQGKAEEDKLGNSCAHALVNECNAILAAIRLNEMDNHPPAPVAEPKKKKVKTPSRSQRWADASEKALAAINEISNSVDELESACSELQDVQSEYSDWKDNLPENLASSALGEKLEEVCNLDIESIADNVRSAVDEASSTLEEANGIDLPRGFGRD